MWGFQQLIEISIYHFKGDKFNNQNHWSLQAGKCFDHILFFSRSNVSNNFSFALTGDTWSWIKTNRPHLVPSLVTKGVVFSRMNPEHKQQLVQDLQGIGYCVGK